jgi:hypothetical protein
MKKYALSILFSVVILLFSILACSIPGVPSAPVVPTSTLIDINSLMQPTQSPVTDQGSPATVPATMAVAVPVSGACANAYYPAIAGATWTYSLTGAVSDTFTRSVTAVTSDGFTDQDVFGTGTTRTGQWKCDAGSLIGLNPSSGGASANVQAAGVNANFQTTAMDGISFPANFASGATWSQSFTIEGTQNINGQDILSRNQTANNCTAGASESVTVPAGTFTALRVDCQTAMTITVVMNGSEIPTSLNMTSASWYAQGVGMIKSVSNLADGSISTIELTTYHFP